MKKLNNQPNPEHLAKAKLLGIPVSTKQCIEICNHLRYKKISFAKTFLEDVAALRKAVPFKKFNRDMGHKKGMSAGRFPQKAAIHVLDLIKSVESNAQDKGLNAGNLKIIKMIANKAAIPITGGRHRNATKRTHLEIEVKEILSKRPAKNEVSDKKSSVDTTSKNSKKEEIKKKENDEQKQPIQKTEPIKLKTENEEQVQKPVQQEENKENIQASEEKAQ